MKKCKLQLNELAAYCLIRNQSWTSNKHQFYNYVICVDIHYDPHTMIVHNQKPKVTDSAAPNIEHTVTLLQPLGQFHNWTGNELELHSMIYE